MIDNPTNLQDVCEFIKKKFKVNWKFEIVKNGDVIQVNNFDEVKDNGFVEFVIYYPNLNTPYKASFDINSSSFKLISKEANDYGDGYYYSVARDLSLDWINFQCQKYGEDAKAFCFDSLDKERMKKIAKFRSKKAELLRQLDELEEESKKAKAYYEILKSNVKTSNFNK